MTRLMQHHGELGQRTHRVMTDSGLKTISDAGEPSVARTTPRHSPQLDREKPDTTDASSDRSAPASQPGRWRRPLLIMGPVVLAVGALALYLMTGRYVSEEDAYVQAMSVSISPQVSGQVVQGNDDRSRVRFGIRALLPPQNATGNWVKVVQRIACPSIRT